MAFRLFPRLPTELRQQIWNAALPREIGQTLYCYKTGCWEPRQLTEVDEGFEPTHETNLYLTFQEELLDPVLFEIPLLFVNREARIVAQQWLTRHGIDSYQSKDDHSIVFACRFNTDRDSLYVDHDALSYFIVEPGEREFALDLTGKPLMFSPASVKHLALPVTVFLPEMGYELVYVLVCNTFARDPTSCFHHTNNLISVGRILLSHSRDLDGGLAPARFPASVKPKTECQQTMGG